MHGLPPWFGWLLAALYYAPYIAGGLCLAVVVYAVWRPRKKK